MDPLPGRPTVCLNLIVRDEARVIERCLASAKPLIDSWVIIDTGSTDDTRERIRRAMRGIPGELLESTWVDFAHNRNEALREARKRADYVLLIDADEEFVAEPGIRFPPPGEDSYLIEIRDGRRAYKRVQLVRSSQDWQYAGVLHEYLFSSQTVQPQVLRGLHILTHRDGARAAKPGSLRRDAELLEEEIRKDPGNARCALYLGQTYFSCGELQKALAMYRKRIELGGWEEENWYALYQAAEVLRAMEAPVADVLAAYDLAFQYRRTRVEPLYRMAAVHRWREDFEAAYLVLARARIVPLPEDEMLFVERGFYEYLVSLAYASVCYRTGRFEEAIRECDKALASGTVPPDSVEEFLRIRRRSLAASGRPQARP